MKKKKSSENFYQSQSSLYFFSFFSFLFDICYTSVYKKSYKIIDFAIDLLSKISVPL